MKLRRRSLLSLTLRIALTGLGYSNQACLGFAHHTEQLPLPAHATEAGMRRLEVNAGRYMGISDLDGFVGTDGHLHLVIVPERQRAILTLEAPSTRGDFRSPELLTVDTLARNIEGIAPDLDTESLAVLSPNTMALGTESPWSGRKFDTILLVATERHPAKVAASIRFEYAPYGVLAESNAGLEGLCYAGNVLIAASESTGHLADGRRFAPLGHKTETDGHFVPHKLLLTSETGRISALACRPVGKPGAHTLEVLAIERHYGVSRILRFELATDAAPGGHIAAQLALDLAPLLQPMRNYEGIAWLANGDLLLVADNSMGFATGPTEALLVPASMLAPKP